MNKNYANALDEILKYIRRADNREHAIGGEGELHVSMAGKTLTKYLNENGFPAVKQNEVENMVLHLRKDEYITSSNDILSLTFKGLDWSSAETGGFTKQRENEINQASRARIAIDRAEKNADRLTWGTWGLVMVTTVLVLIDFLSHYDEIRHTLHLWFCACK